MKTNTSKLTFSAVLAAAVIAFIYITAIVDTMQITSAVIATLAVMLTQKICGRKYAISHYITVSALLFILLPNKFFAVLYALFFGLHAIIKSIVEQKNNLKTEWIFKILYFAAAAALIIVGFRFMAADGLYLDKNKYILIYFAIIAVMAVFDIFLSFFGTQFFIMADKYLKKF